MLEDLKLQALAIGSLPHSEPKEAMCIVEEDFSEIPFFPQLASVSKNEDMIFQFLEGMPSYKAGQEFCPNQEDENLWLEIEEFFSDYEDITSDMNSEKLERYAISKDYSSTFSLLEELITKTKPRYAKGQIVGPFTLASSFVDTEGKYLLYDETFRDIITKLLSLKVLWQIKRIKKANKDCIPIIFIDEPTISQMGTSAYMTVTEETVIEMISEISKIIQDNGGISAIHCCGKCDWRIPLKSNVNIVNMDAYNFAQNFAIYHTQIKSFLENGGKIAWGIVPTMSDKLLDEINTDILLSKFEQSVNYLTKKGINEKLIIDNSLITSSCGAGALSVPASRKAMDFIFKLSKTLKERY